MRTRFPVGVLLASLASSALFAATSPQPEKVTLDALLVRSAWYLADPVPASKAKDLPLPTGGAARNAVPIYAAANQTVRSHYLADMPIRTSASAPSISPAAPWCSSRP